MREPIHATCLDCGREALSIAELVEPICQAEPTWTVNGELVERWLCPCSALLEVVIAEDAAVEPAQAESARAA